MAIIGFCLLAVSLLATTSANSLRKQRLFSPEELEQVQLQWQAYRRNYEQDERQDGRQDGRELPPCEPHDIAESCWRATNLTINESTPIRLRSLSPYEYCKSEDNTRYPSLFTQTRCMCTQCFNYSRSLQDDIQLNSVSIQVSMPVVRFTDSVSLYKQCNATNCQIEFIDVTVGCHCVIRD